MYGAQTVPPRFSAVVGFENDVEMYGAQTFASAGIVPSGPMSRFSTS